MINKTVKPVLVNPGISAAKLNRAIRDAIRYTIRKESEHLGSVDGSPVLRDGQSMHTFSFFFTKELKGSQVYGEKFIQAAYDVSQTSGIRNLQKVPGLDGVLTVTPTVDLNGYRSVRIRSGLRTVILHLWSRRILLIPLPFTVETSIKDDVYQELLSEVAALFYNYNHATVGKPHKHHTPGSWGHTDFDTILRLIWTTDWHTFEQVDLDELSKFHILMLTGNHDFPNLHFNFVPMLEELVKQHEGRLKFTAEDVELYRKWVRGGWYVDHAFDYFRTNFTKLRMDRRRRYGQRNKEKYREGILRRNGLEIQNGLDLSKPAMHILLEAVAAKGDHEAAVDYFAKLSGLDRNYSSTAGLPGREHVDIAALSTVWMQTFADWFDYRFAQGREDTTNPRQEIKLLCDYLFCYLPWWLELHPNVDIQFPYTPADFDRFLFFVPGSKGAEESPMPFKEMLKLRRKTINSLGRAISVIHQYFEYVRAYVNRYPEMADRTVVNPVVLTIDYPKGRKRLGSKTNKIPFSKKVMPYLLRYLYALEEFGMHLQCLAIRGELQLTLKSQPSVFRPEDYGYHLKFEFGGKTYVIQDVPNIFQIARRTVRTREGDLISVEIPHLSSLRILIVGLETGLRMQAVQWLDLRTWDQMNADKSSDLYVYDLYVNTDKTLDEPWVAPMVYRARNVLQREQEFQQSIIEEGMDTLIPYEYRDKSRFADVLPLFRTSGFRGNPVDDAKYTVVWLNVLLGFQGFYNEEVSREGFTQFVTVGPYYLGGLRAEGNERVDYTAERAPYCPLKYTAIHTPHSARATFISNRSGILDTEDIADAVGHTDKRTTYHYTVEEYEQIVAKIQATDQMLWEFDPNNPAHVRADGVNSSLRCSLEKDRAEAEKRFGFVSVSLINEKDENFKDGVELLRATPMNQVVFRETHICPVGEACPKDIEDLIHEPRRCGLCPLAVKSVDHLPAITAKMRQLLEQVESATVLLEKMERRGEPEAVLNQINERRKLDTFEYTGWMRALEILSDIFRNMKCNADVFHVDEPEIVKRHLKLVVKQTDKVEFILDRIMDVNAYPSMQTPELSAKANLLRQQLLANLGRVEEALQEIESGDEVAVFLSSLRAEMKALGLNLRQVIEMKLLENRRAVIPAARSLLLPQSTDSSSELGA
jgi:hypothetical protein